MKYRDKSFSVHMGSTESYRDNYDRTFGKKGEHRAPLLVETPLEHAAREATEDLYIPTGYDAAKHAPVYERLIQCGFVQRGVHFRLIDVMGSVLDEVDRLRKVVAAP